MKAHHITVLLYHQIGNTPNANTNFDCYCKVSDFKNQMSFLYENNFKVITLSHACQLMEQSANFESDYVVLSFDDGCASFYDCVHPILAEFEFPAVLYPVVGYLGRNASWKGLTNNQISILSSKKLRELSNSGYEIGSHTIEHPRLTTLQTEKICEQLTGSKEILEDIICKPVRSFSYPHGDFNSETITILKECGYVNAVTCKSDFAEMAPSQFEIPRKYVTYFETASEFSEKFK
jgi:peptidoglycan/xylan/chitin deacetylase (PgdA/CDA1 family)